MLLITLVGNTDNLDDHSNINILKTNEDREMIQNAIGQEFKNTTIFIRFQEKLCCTDRQYIRK